jgi:hypothetical protein
MSVRNLSHVIAGPKLLRIFYLVIAGLDPAIQGRLLCGCCSRMPGSSPGMTEWMGKGWSP